MGTNLGRKIANVYIVYDLGNCPKNRLRNFTLKHYLFGVTGVVKKVIKKNVYKGYGIGFDWKGEWTYGNGLAKNVIVFGVDNSLSSHTDNLKNDFLILGEDPNFWY